MSTMSMLTRVVFVWALVGVGAVNVVPLQAQENDLNMRPEKNPVLASFLQDRELMLQRHYHDVEAAKAEDLKTQAQAKLLASRTEMSKVQTEQLLQVKTSSRVEDITAEAKAEDEYFREEYARMKARMEKRIKNRRKEIMKRSSSVTRHDGSEP